MDKKIPDRVRDLYLKLENAGYEAYLVGGCVRNLLMDLPVTDWDLATNATPEKIQEIFPDSFCDNAFGTVGVKFEDSKDEKDYAEITTYRTEKNYTDFRHPGEVKWGDSIEEDLSRRDFTINAVALKLSKDGFIFVDPHNGKSDIKLKLIRAESFKAKAFMVKSLRDR